MTRFELPKVTHTKRLEVVGGATVHKYDDRTDPRISNDQHLSVQAADCLAYWVRTYAEEFGERHLKRACSGLRIAARVRCAQPVPHPPPRFVDARRDRQLTVLPACRRLV